MPAVQKFPAAGKVFLTGAGPGDPELLTLKAARVLGLADVILIDDLVHRAVLAHARADARIIEVGKRGGCKSTPQDFIERLMIRAARAGKQVVRLKGGDPFVFGRGGEEMLALEAAGIEMEIICGVTSGIAVPAALGIPVTHRALARGVTFVTGHTRNGHQPDWRALAATANAAATTLVIYMGMQDLPVICEELMAGGLSGDTAAAAIQSGTLAEQRQVIASLATLAAAAGEAQLASPAIVVIGDVVRFARQAMTGAKPLEQAA